MRDDIHKRAPGPRHWRRVVKSLQRDSDWREAGADAAARAVVAELAAAEGPSFFAVLDREVASPQLEFVRDLGPAVDAASAGRIQSTVQKFTVGHLLRLCAERPNARDLVPNAVAAGIRTMLDAYKRDLDVVLACEFPRYRAEMLKRFGAVFDSLPLVRRARDIASGVLPEIPGGPRPLDLDAAIA